jgi:hypothetical protein
VQAARVDLEEIAFLNGNLPNQLLPAALLHHPAHVLPGFGIVANDNSRPRIAVQHIPTLGFAPGAVFVLCGIMVIGMHLNAQILFGVNNLNQQGKAISRNMAEQIGAFFPERAHRLSGKLRILQTAIAAGVTADGPAFAGMVAGRVIVKSRSQAVAAPNFLLKYRLHAQQGFAHSAPPFST